MVGGVISILDMQYTDVNTKVLPGIFTRANCSQLFVTTSHNFHRSPGKIELHVLNLICLLILFQISFSAQSITIERSVIVFNITKRNHHNNLPEITSIFYI